MSSAAKRKGTAWESSVVELLRGLGWPRAERRALNGTQDRGDVAGVPDLVIECKSAATLRLREWCDEAKVEAERDGSRYHVVALKRTGSSDPAEGYAVIKLGTFFEWYRDYDRLRAQEAKQANDAIVRAAESVESVE